MGVLAGMGADLYGPWRWPFRYCLPTGVYTRVHGFWMQFAALRRALLPVTLYDSLAGVWMVVPRPGVLLMAMPSIVIMSLPLEGNRKGHVALHQNTHHRPPSAMLARRVRVGIV